MSTYAAGTYATATYGGAGITVIPGRVTALAAQGARATAGSPGTVTAAHGATA